VSPICGPGCLVAPAPAAPRTGSNWVWFGSSDTEQSQRVDRVETFAAEPVTAALSFYVWVGEFENESGRFRARFDGVPVFTIDQTNQSDYADGYTRVVVPLGDPVPGKPHQVLFEYDSDAAPGDITDISLDDVSVETTYLHDGDFEAAVAPNPFDPMYFDSPGWTESADDGVDSPVCEETACGVFPGEIREPHGGSQWGYFGFSHNASLSQVATTPALSDAAVSFFLVADDFENPGAKLTVKVDGATRFSLDAANEQLFGDHYRLVTLPLGALSAGGHSLVLEYHLPSSGGAAIVNVDDVALSGTLAPLPGPPPAQPVAPGPPQTRITKLKLLTSKSKGGKPKLGAKFSFVGSGGSGKVKFQCKLDKGRFRPCASPRKYSSLKTGNHGFQVRAVDATGAADATPAKRSFQIALPKPRRGSSN
jgi:hypothetical protein